LTGRPFGENLVAFLVLNCYPLTNNFIYIIIIYKTRIRRVNE